MQPLPNRGGFLEYSFAVRGTGARADPAPAVHLTREERTDGNPPR